MEGDWKVANNAGMIIDLDKKRMRAMAAKDTATLLADDLVYTHSSARLDTKQSLIANMKSGATVYSAVDPSEVWAQDLGDAVILTGVAQIKVSSNGKLGILIPMLINLELSPHRNFNSFCLTY